MLEDIQKTLWATADKLRANMDAAEYKHLVLGLIFLKYVADTFAARRAEVQARLQNPADEFYFADGKLGELVDLVSTISFGTNAAKARNVLGQVYEYFLGQFASADGKKGGQFYRPASIVKTLVAVLTPPYRQGVRPLLRQRRHVFSERNS